MTARRPESERVAERAYSIWEEEGRPHGRDHAHWHRAESELAEPTGGGAPNSADEAPSAPARKPARARKAVAAAGASSTVEPGKPVRTRKAAAPKTTEEAAAPKRSRTKAPTS